MNEKQKKNTQQGEVRKHGQLQKYTGGIEGVSELD